MSEDSVEQRARFDHALSDFVMQRSRPKTARNAHHYYWDDFQDLEREFLATIEQLRRADGDQAQKLLRLQSLRIELSTSLDDRYRQAVNELADALLASIAVSRESQEE